jgi:hypothetical protein
MNQGFYSVDQGKGLQSPAPSPGPHPRLRGMDQLLLENRKRFGTYNGGRPEQCIPKVWRHGRDDLFEARRNGFNICNENSPASVEVRSPAKQQLPLGKSKE